MKINFANISLAKRVDVSKSNIEGLEVHGSAITWTPVEGSEYYFSSSVFDQIYHNDTGSINFESYADEYYQITVTITEINKTYTKVGKVLLTLYDAIGSYIIGNNFVIS